MPGVLASQQIKGLIDSGAVRAETPVKKEQIQPASLDLRLGSTAYRVEASFLAGANASISERLKEFGTDSFSLAGGAVLEMGAVYVVPLVESLNLPSDVDAVANAKSSTGRLDLLTRAITDGGTEFDRIPAGYSGMLHAEICPLSFSVVVHPGMALNQIRFRNDRAALNDDQLRNLHNEVGLVDSAPVISDGLGFSVDLKSETGIHHVRSTKPTQLKMLLPTKEEEEAPLVGYRAKSDSINAVDLNKIGEHDPLDYWEEVRSADGRIILKPSKFYILVSRETVRIPPTHAAEMAPYLAMAGEFRVHYAGFFDPGFGYSPTGGKGSRAVLEVRCHDAPFMLEHGQIVGRLIYEKMDQKPKQLYGKGLKSNYQGQGLKLSKHFMTID